MTKPRGKDDRRDIDKGWAWMILLGSNIGICIVAGTTKSFGILFTELVVKFDKGPAETAWATFTFGMVTMVTSLVAGYMCDHMSMRWPVIFSCALGAGGMVMAAISNTLLQFTFGFGVCGGIAQGVMLCSIQTAVTYYFEKKIVMSQTLCAVAASICSMLLPMLFQWTLTYYAVSGTMFVMGAVWLQGCISGIILQPKNVIKPKGAKIPSERGAKTKDVEYGKMPVEMVELPRKSSEDNIKQPANSSEKASVDDGSGKGDHKIGSNVEELAPNNKNGDVNNVSLAKNNDPVDVPCALHSEEPATQDFSQGDMRSELNKNEKMGLDVAKEPDVVEKHHTEEIKDTNAPKEPEKYDALSSKQPPETSPLSEAEIQIQPLSKESGAISRSSYNCCSKLGARVSHVTNLFVNPMFLRLLVAYTAYHFAYYSWFLFFPAYVMESGLTRADATVCIMVNSFVELLGRLVIGSITQKTGINPSAPLGITTFMAAATCLLCPFARGWAASLIFSIMFGITGGFFNPMKVVVFVRAVGKRNMGTAIGFCQMFSSIGISSGGPLLGLLQEVTGTYSTTMRAIGLSYLLAGIFVVWNLFVERRRKETASFGKPAASR